MYRCSLSASVSVRRRPEPAPLAAYRSAFIAQPTVEAFMKAFCMAHRCDVLPCDATLIGPCQDGGSAADWRTLPRSCASRGDSRAWIVRTALLAIFLLLGDGAHRSMSCSVLPTTRWMSHPQVYQGPGLARPPAALKHSLHADLRLPGSTGIRGTRAFTGLS